MFKKNLGNLSWGVLYNVFSLSRTLWIVLQEIAEDCSSGRRVTGAKGKLKHPHRQR